MEFFTKVHWSIPLVIFVPVVVYFLVQGWRSPQSTFLSYVLSLGCGLFFWTLLEYLLHRFFFHFHPRGKFSRRIFFILHGIHHDYPNDSWRLVLPPVLSIPSALGFYFLLSRLLPFQIFAPFYGALVLGYLAYDMIHYSSHHLAMRGKVGLFLKRYHLNHHFKDEGRGFGVSSPIWDWVFQSSPRKIKAGASS